MRLQVELSGGIRDDDSLERALATGLRPGQYRHRGAGAARVVRRGDRRVRRQDRHRARRPRPPARRPRLDPGRRRPVRRPRAAGRGRLRPLRGHRRELRRHAPRAQPAPAASRCASVPTPRSWPAVGSPRSPTSRRWPRWSRSASRARSSAPRCTSATSPWSRPLAVARLVTDLADPSVLQQHAAETPVEVTGGLLEGRLKDLLAGKKILMTGVTGFIGEQLLWKILTDLPETTPAVLVRRKRSAGARDRMIGVLKKDIFADLREAAGGLGGAAGRPGRRDRGRSAERARAAARHRHRRALRRRRLVRSADRPGLHHERDRHQGPDGSDDRGLHRRRRHPGQDPALRAHLHRLHRWPAARRHPGGPARALDRLPGRDAGRLWPCGS